MPIVRIAAAVIVGQYGLAEIRPFEGSDAEAAAELVQPLQPGIVVTAAFLAQHAEPERARRRSWLAIANGETVGFGTSAVAPDHRGRRRPRRGRFVEARGFEPISAEIVSSLDPQLADLGELDRLLAETSAASFELEPLDAMAGRHDDLAAFYEAAGAWPPGGDDANRITAEELWRYIFERPDLSWDGSFVVVDGQDRLVLWRAWSSTARRHGRRTTGPRRCPSCEAANRCCWQSSRRFARHATPGSARSSPRTTTTNVPMLALNERLGYRRQYEQVEMARTL